MKVDVWLLSCFLIVEATATKEHKVHNIVLYPEKHSWCKTTSIKQIITEAECTSQEIDNSVCVGGCFSYSVPETHPSMQYLLQYCDSCQPTNYSWVPVLLECNSGQVMKKVQIIESCECAKCPTHQYGGSSMNEIPEVTTKHVPELMWRINRTHASRLTERREMDDQQLREKLQQLMETAQLDDEDKHFVNNHLTLHP